MKLINKDALTMFKTIGMLKKIETAITVAGVVIYTFDLMTKTFKWYERKYGKGNDKKDITRPIIKGR